MNNNHLLITYLSITYVPFGIFTTVESALQIKLFMQNKAKFRKVKLNVSKVLTKDCEQMDTWSIRKTKPIQSQLKPIKCQNKPNTNPNKANIMLMLPEWVRKPARKLSPIAKMENIVIIIAVA
jgi:hypothetical protein